jgi:hypothetical protein
MIALGLYVVGIGVAWLVVTDYERVRLIDCILAIFWLPVVIWVWARDLWRYASDKSPEDS